MFTRVRLLLHIEVVRFIVRDEYDYVGDTSYQTNMILTANFVDDNADATKETVEITIKNTTSADVGTFKFRVNQKR